MTAAAKGVEDSTRFRQLAICLAIFINSVHKTGHARTSQVTRSLAEQRLQIVFSGAKQLVTRSGRKKVCEVVLGSEEIVCRCNLPSPV